MTSQTQIELQALARSINQKYNVEEIDYLVSLLKQKRLDELRKALPYGAYASASTKCPYCGK
jgi:hypothetical protein